MKKFIISFFLLVGITCYSQTYTKKYNSLSRQYEYFDSIGSMIGYEVYNNMTRQWEYYEVKQRQPYQYRDPAPVDMSSTFQAQSILQKRYDNNTNYLRQEVSKMEQYVYDLDIPDSQKKQILQTFQDVSLKSINSQTINYSNSNTTNEVVNYLRKSLGKIINNVTSVKTSKVETPTEKPFTYNPKTGIRDNYPSNSDMQNKILESISKHFNKKLKVSVITQSIDNSIIKHKIKTISYVILNDEMIEFKRADGSVAKWYFTDKYIDIGKFGIEYSSQYGSIFVRRDFEYVEFYDTPSSPKNYYKYTISL